LPAYQHYKERLEFSEEPGAIKGLRQGQQEQNKQVCLYGGQYQQALDDAGIHVYNQATKPAY